MNWRQAGMILEFTPDFNPHPTYYAKLLHENNFRWLSIKIHDGLAVVDLDPLWIKMCKEAGISVGGWGVLQSNPWNEAHLADRLIRKHELEHYTADAEAAHKNDTNGNSKCSVIFTQEFAKLQPFRFPRLFTSYGAASGDNLLGSVTDAMHYVMDYQTWYRYGWRFAPQVYPNEFGDIYSLHNCLQHAKRAGWPISFVKPMLGNYNNWHAENYRDDLRREYVQNRPYLRGLSIFIAHTCREEDIQDYGRYIKNWWLADT